MQHTTNNYKQKQLFGSGNFRSARYAFTCWDKYLFKTATCRAIHLVTDEDSKKRKCWILSYRYWITIPNCEGES